MCIIRVKKQASTPYCRIDNRFLQSSLLSIKAKGLLAQLLSRPDNWKIRFSELQQSNADGENAIRSTIKELEKHGYIKRHVSRDKLGRFHTDYTIYEVSQLEEKKDEGKNQQDGDRVKKLANTAQTIPTVAQKVDSNNQVASLENKPKESANRDDFIKILEVVENVADKKAIMESLESAMKRGIVKNPKAYLAGIIKKYQNGDFTPVKKENQNQSPVPKKSDAEKELINNCPHCNERGRIQGYILNDGESSERVFDVNCSHDENSLDNFISKNRGKLLEIFTSDVDEYRNPPKCHDVRKEMERRKAVKREKCATVVNRTGNWGGNSSEKNNVFSRILDTMTGKIDGVASLPCAE